MPITVNEGGVLHELTEVTANEGGALYNFDTVHSNENGLINEIFSTKIFSWHVLGTATVILSVDNMGLVLSFQTKAYYSTQNTPRLQSNNFALKTGQKVCFEIVSKTCKSTNVGATLYKADGSKVGAIYSNNLTKAVADTDGDYYIVIFGNTFNTSTPTSSNFVAATLNIEFTIT